MWHNFKQVDYKYHLICAFLMRALVIQYGHYHDENYSVPFTDIDYKVFTDAARHVVNGTSPYNRHTYRYSPVVAFLLTPNIHFESFGKLLFSAIDLIAAVLIRLIVKNALKEYECYKQRQQRGEKLRLTHPADEKPGKRQSGRRKKHKPIEVKKNESDITADLSMLLWLYNPMTIAIATRGNCDSIAGVLVLATLYFLECKHRPFVAGILHGIAVHVRLYPLVYSLALFMYLSKFSFYSSDYRRKKLKDQKNNETDTKSLEPLKSLGNETKPHKRHKQVKKVQKQNKTDVKPVDNTKEVAVPQLKNEKRTIFKKEYLYYLIPNVEQLKLITGTILSLSLLTATFYLLYGHQFLHETYIYHLIRRDTRHNFSLYFYLQYLTTGIKNVGAWQKLLTLLPQVILLVVFSVRYGLNRLTLNFAVFTQTVVIVSYNTVVTSQYFVWILAVLPLCLWQIKMSKKIAFSLLVIWFVAQAAWLLPTYFLEFHGHNTFIYIWVQSVSFFCANMAILGRFIRNFMPDCN